MQSFAQCAQICTALHHLAMLLPKSYAAMLIAICKISNAICFGLRRVKPFRTQGKHSNGLNP